MTAAGMSVAGEPSGRSPTEKRSRRGVSHLAGGHSRLIVKLSGCFRALKAIPEYRDGLKKGSGPRILIGDAKKPAGKIFVDMTGGTEGSKKVFGRLSQAGVGTIVCMHLSEEHLKNAKDEGINIVIAGHIASDTLGLNLLLDEIEKTERLRIIPCSGFIRIRRQIAK